jgi:Ca2+-binding EF-hand superfamily protein
MRQMCKENPEQCKAMMKERADKWWARVDTNKDGMVSREEAEANAPRLAKDFDKVDADHNGLITREELESAARAKMAERRAHQGGASQN